MIVTVTVLVRVGRVRLDVGLGRELMMGVIVQLLVEIRCSHSLSSSLPLPTCLLVRDWSSSLRNQAAAKTQRVQPVEVRV